MSVNILYILREATEFLKRSGIEDAERDAEIILTHCLGIDRVTLYRDNPVVSEKQAEQIDKFLTRRSKREPLQYIIGYIEFYGLKIKIGKGVLIPRPETEVLVEEAIKTVTSYKLQVTSKDKDSSLITHYPLLNILDLCTGSGCVALALAREFHDAHVYGTDTSRIAIRNAKKNAELNSITNVTFLKGNLFEPIKKQLSSHASHITFDLIVSNPPYVRIDEIKDLQPEIKDWEPVEALNGGEDGLDYYRMIIPEAKNYLKEGGHLLFEIGASQADSVRKMVKDAGFTDVLLIKDYAGIERILRAKLGIV